MTVIITVNLHPKTLLVKEALYSSYFQQHLSSSYRLSRSSDTSSHVCRAPVTRHLVAVTCSSCVSPTLVMRQSYAILSLGTRQMCPPRPRTLEIERLESSKNVEQHEIGRA